MANHTPGPWRIDPSPNAGGLIVESAGVETPRRIADCIGDDLNPSAECRANARLIAAAPELLALARATDAEMSTMIPYLQGPFLAAATALRDAARDAVRKARNAPEKS